MASLRSRQINVGAQASWIAQTEPRLKPLSIPAQARPGQPLSVHLRLQADYVETGEIDPRFRHQSRQPGNEIERLDERARRIVTDLGRPYPRPPGCWAW